MDRIATDQTNIGYAWAACASKSGAPRLAPAGGSEQAKAEICASTLVSYWRGFPGCVFNTAFEIGAPGSPDSRTANNENRHDLGFRNAPIKRGKNVRSIDLSRMARTLRS